VRCANCSAAEEESDDGDDDNSYEAHGFDGLPPEDNDDE
jgi:hypothetical protein